MQGAALKTFIVRELQIYFQRITDKTRDRRIDIHQVINMLLFEQTFMRDIERNKRDGNSRMEHNMRGMWVHEDVELRQWTHIPCFLNGAAHDHQFLDGFCEP